MVLSCIVLSSPSSWLQDIWLYPQPISVLLSFSTSLILQPPTFNHPSPSRPGYNNCIPTSGEGEQVRLGSCARLGTPPLGSGHTPRHRRHVSRLALLKVSGAWWPIGGYRDLVGFWTQLWTDWSVLSGGNYLGGTELQLLRGASMLSCMFYSRIYRVNAPFELLEYSFFLHKWFCLCGWML